MTLDENIKQKVLEDYEIVQITLGELQETGRNCLVVSAGYLSPTIVFGTDLPKDHWQGEFKHYSRIKEALDKALTTGKIPKELLTCKVPDYLKNLME